MVMKHAIDLNWIRKILVLVLCLQVRDITVGQTPSGYTAAFLNLTTSARVAALGICILLQFHLQGIYNGTLRHKMNC